MRPDSGYPDPHELLASQGFLLRLARGLVRDEHAADDLVQDAWVAALERPGDGRRTRGWFARILRHRAIDVGVGERRRAAREERAARPEASPSPADLERRLDASRRVLVALQALGEPRRTALFLRYYEELSPTEIARRQGVPLATVKTRLARGRELLRAALDREFGSRRDWCLAFLPLAPVRGLAAALSGGVAVSTSWKSVGALGVAVVGVFAWWGVGEIGGVDPAPTGLAAAPSGAELERAAPVDAAAPPSGPAERSEVLSPEPVEAPPAVAAGPRPPLVARVVDVRGIGVAGVKVRLAKGRSQPARSSDAGGIVRFDPIDTVCLLGAEDPHWVTVCRAVARPRSEREPVVVVAAPAPRSGVVVDGDGAPLEGARLEVWSPRGLRNAIPFPMEDSIDVRPSTASDASGRFEIDGAPRIPGTVLVATLGGYAPRSLALPESPEGDLEVVLARAEGPHVLHGVVIDRDGRPVEGARVSFGGEATRSAADGSFALDADPASDANAGLARRVGGVSRVLRAVREGYLPGVLEVELDAASGSPLWPENVVLELAGEALSVRGRVVDGNGEPLAGRAVYVKDTTWFSSDINGQPLENVMAGDADDRWHTVATDARGAFELGGLSDRAYTIVALDPDTGLQAHREGVRGGGAEVELVLDAADVWQSVEGIVVDRRGEALAGVEIAVMGDGSDMLHDGRFVRTSSFVTARTTTDESGSFRLGPVPKRHAYLYITGDAVESGRVFRDEPLGDRDAERLEGVELVAVQRARLRVVLADPSEADAFSVLDDSGAILGLRTYRVKAGKPQRSAPLVGGRSEVVSTAAHAATLVLYAGGEEVRRAPIVLAVGELSEIEP